MDKKALFLLLAATTFTTSAFATNIINKILPKHHVSKIHQVTKQNHRSYTDFTGTWEGTCGDEKVSTTIESGYNFIGFDGQYYHIGQGVQGEYQSTEEGMYQEHFSIEWQANETELAMNSTFVSKDNAEGAGLRTGMGKTVMAMQNGQLTLNTQLSMYENGTQIDQPWTMQCVFKKKQ